MEHLWRDYIDIVQLPARHDNDKAQIRTAAEAVARHRNIDLVPIGRVIAGYGAIAQAKWAAWRRKEGVEDISEENLDDQMALVAAVARPIRAPRSTWVTVQGVRRSRPETVSLSDRSQPAYQKVLERNLGGGVGSGQRCS